MRNSKRKTAQDDVQMVHDEEITGKTPEGYTILMAPWSDRAWTVTVYGEGGVPLMGEVFDTEDEAFAIVEGLESGEISYTASTPGRWGSKRAGSRRKVQSSDSMEINVTSDACDGYLYFSRNGDGTFNGELDIVMFANDEEVHDSVEGVSMGEVVDLVVANSAGDIDIAGLVDEMNFAVEAWGGDERLSSRHHARKSSHGMHKHAWEQDEDGAIRGYTPEGYAIYSFPRRNGSWAVWVEDDKFTSLMEENFNTEDEAFAIIEGLESGEISYLPPVPARWGKKHRASLRKKA